MQEIQKLDKDTVTLIDSVLSEEERMARWIARKPEISHLKEGVVEVAGELYPLFNIKQRIVVERYAKILKGAPWLDTLVGLVKSIDDDTGHVTIADEESDQRAPIIYTTSYKDGYHKFKLAPARGSPFNAASAIAAEKAQQRIAMQKERAQRRAARVAKKAERIKLKQEKLEAKRQKQHVAELKRQARLKKKEK